MTDRTRTAPHHERLHGSLHLDLDLRDPPLPRQSRPPALPYVSADAHAVHGRSRHSQNETGDDHGYHAHDTHSHVGVSYLIQIDDVESHAYDPHPHTNLFEEV